MMSAALVVLGVLLMQTGALGFGILPGESLSHLEIMERAILNVTVQACRSLAQVDGTPFTLPAEPFTAETVAIACAVPQSAKSFKQAINRIKFENLRVDLRHAFNASFHFDEEKFIEGRRIITTGLSAIKASNKQGNFDTAREKLGEITHPLQDFYSHSNYVELGNKAPNTNLIQAGTNIGNIAAESRATCRNCDGDDCRNNILDDIIKDQILTSGYFGVVPFQSTKPKGKCSHGGSVDKTSTIEPTGGINKDTFSSSHGHLHTAAANMAIAATVELLEDIRGATSDKEFLEMLGISKGSNKALCFVIDTTKSMSEAIEVVRKVTAIIIDSKEGTADEPSVYILVPFSDPDVGPLIKTTDSEIFRKIINSLSAEGGGDAAENSLSGLQLALAAAPFQSEVFLFTDAPAKDRELKNTVIALIERTKTAVNFLITDTVGNNQRKRRANRLKASDVQLYKDLAEASGGKAIEVSQQELLQATNIIVETSISSLVTLLQAARSPGKTDKFRFIVDKSVKDLTVFITGRSVTFTFKSPSGASQSSSQTGSLITSSQSVGNFQTLKLKTEVGQWEVEMVSKNPYTLKVIAQSPIDFIFDFVEESQGLFEGYEVLDTRPRAGVAGKLLMFITGTDFAKVTDVTLVESSGSGDTKGSVLPRADGSFLVEFDMMPSVPFFVRVKGVNGSNTGSPQIFERQTATNFRTSNLTISVDSIEVLEPGTPFPVPFFLNTSGHGGNFSIRATNNQNFKMTFPSSLFLETGGAANGTVILSAPRKTPSGTDVTLVIEAEDPADTDENYAVLRISVFNPVTDFTDPVCELLSAQSNCSDNSSLSMWELLIRVTDGDDGTGVDRVSLKRGNGTFNASKAPENENITIVTYESFCSSPEMQLLAVDQVGNVGSCFYTFKSKAVSGPTQITLLFLSIMMLGFYVLTEMGIQ